MELVSIVIPVYNVEKYLEKCINSVINQTYTKLEIILVDDGSTDNSLNICERYKKIDNRIVVIHKENGGLSDARNHGISVANGKYITFIDSDDYICDDYIVYLLNILKENNALISCANLVSVDEEGIECGYCGRSDAISVFNTETALGELLENRNISNSASAKLYLTDLFKDVRYPVGKHFEDVATTYKLFMKADIIVKGDRPVYYYLVRKGSISRSSFNDKSLDLIENSKKMTDDILKKYPGLLAKAEDRVFDSYLMVLGICSDNNISNDLMSNIKIMRKRVIKNNGFISKRTFFALCSYLPGFQFLWKMRG